MLSIQKLDTKSLINAAFNKGNRKPTKLFKNEIILI